MLPQYLAMRDVFVELCHLAHLRVKVEEGSGLTPDMSHTRLADVLVQNWIGAGADTGFSKRGG